MLMKKQAYLSFLIKLAKNSLQNQKENINSTLYKLKA